VKDPLIFFEEIGEMFVAGGEKLCEVDKYKSCQLNIRIFSDPANRFEDVDFLEGE
jgi:hypothetical protein